ncbi:MAG: 3-hydroxybutyryl-CoA dehydrogenase [Ignavibacteria bacterium]|nr:3-hydroxybutyryl-CoA dehydrogenase [Ignavibacteria bacterium]
MATEPLTLSDLTNDMPTQAPSTSRIETVGLVGGGVMGRGIAQTLSTHGINVIMLEKDSEGVQACLDGLGENMDREIQRWAMTTGEKRAILSRIKVTTDLNEIAHVDFAMEAVDENFDLKREIIAKLDKLCRPETIIASNTSTLSLSKIAKPALHPGKIIGLHFSNPVPKTPLCEIIRAFHTSDDTFKRTKDFIRMIGKTPVEVYKYPGFITTRTIIPMLNEAMYILMEGVASAEDIDTAMRLGFNFQMGPLELADSMGLEELLAMMESMFHEFGEAKYRPCPLLRRLVREQKYGKKVGIGFFEYDDSGNRIKDDGK